MYVFDIVFTECSVAQMAKKHFSCEFNIFLKIIYVEIARRLCIFQFMQRSKGLIECVDDRRGRIVADAVDVGLSGGHVQLHAGQTGSVLTTVVLLFHEQRHFLKCVNRVAVFCQIKFRRLTEAQKCNSTLMLDSFAHCRV
ncbi:hypothetical protein DSECCO2_540210 [anaerobic digester metagenome]